MPLLLPWPLPPKTSRDGISGVLIVLPLQQNVDPWWYVWCCLVVEKQEDSLCLLACLLDEEPEERFKRLIWTRKIEMDPPADQRSHSSVRDTADSRANCTPPNNRLLVLLFLRFMCQYFVLNKQGANRPSTPSLLVLCRLQICWRVACGLRIEPFFLAGRKSKMPNNALVPARTYNRTYVDVPYMTILPLFFIYFGLLASWCLSSLAF